MAAVTENTFLTAAPLGVLTGASQTALPEDETRVTVNVYNIGNASVWINSTGGVAAASTEGSFELAAGAAWNPVKAPTNKITLIGTAGQFVTVQRG